MFDTAISTQTKISWNLSPGDAQELIEQTKNGDDLVIIDVCSPQEFKDRHLENAININFLSRSFKLRLSTLDKDRTYLVYCKAGCRILADAMAKVGIFGEKFGIQLPLLTKSCSGCSRQ